MKHKKPGYSYLSSHILILSMFLMVCTSMSMTAPHLSHFCTEVKVLSDFCSWIFGPCFVLISKSDYFLQNGI